MSLETLKSKINRLIDKVRAYKVENAELTASNEALQSENETLETRIDELEAAGSAEELENLIDQSEVLDSTDGTATEKVKQLIDKVELFMCATVFNVRGNYQKESIDFYIDLPYAEQLFNLLTNNEYVKKMVGVNTSRIKGFSQAFMNSVIEEIERPFNFSMITAASNINTAFRNAHHLREVRFEEQTLKFDIYFSSKVLSAESIQSIIDGLADLTGQTAQKLTLHTDVVGKLTEKQWEQISNKNWNVG